MEPGANPTEFGIATPEAVLSEFISGRADT
jgi:hypothetical protein